MARFSVPFSNHVLKALCVLLALGPGALAKDEAISGLRVDPAYFYENPEPRDFKKISRSVIEFAKREHFNTLYVYAYNSQYGAFYPTAYKDTHVEPTAGKANVFGMIADAAHREKIKVVAVIPVNQFQSIWKAHPDWRAKRKDGADYQPNASSFFISAWNDDYREWFKGFVADLIKKNPKIDGVEAVEPAVDLEWQHQTDYNPIAMKTFKEKHPNAEPGDEHWKKHRASGLTSLIATMNQVAHSFHKKAYVVQTIPAKADGELFSFSDLSEGTGFDLDAILKLPKNERPDYVMGEFIWQQWREQFSDTSFDPKWTSKAAKQFVELVKPYAEPIIHVEASTFGSTRPGPDEIRQALKSAEEAGAGIDLYSYHLVNTLTQLRAPASQPANSKPERAPASTKH